MSPTDATAIAANIEAFLGDPRQDKSRISFQEALRLDESSAFPERGVATLDEWGMQRFYVPASNGGSISSFEAVTALVRAIARRDLTVAIAHAKTFLGVGPVWFSGTPEQKEKTSAWVVNGAKVALGLTEEAHGGDLFATETSAIETSEGYEISGEKWLINNATRGDGVLVLARTEPKGGPRGFSLFLVKKKEASGYTHLEKIKTHGIRGADISGIRFTRCIVPKSARIGGVGQGLEIMMKSLQLTRTLVPALSLGALDTALRHVLGFARSRRIGSGVVSQIPHARRILTEAFVDLLSAEVLVRASARSIHAAPGRLSIWSAVVKYLVPSRVDAALHRLAIVLGARHYVRGNVFEKILRDHALVALFDGSTVVNVNALAQELPRVFSLKTVNDEAALSERINLLYDLQRPLPGFRPEGFDVMARGEDEGTFALHLAKSEVEALGLEQELKSYLLAYIEAISEGRKVCAESFKSKERPLAQPPEVFAATERYAHLHCAVSCLLLWLKNRNTLGSFFAGGEWLAIALYRLLQHTPPQAAWYERVALRLEELDADNKSFSIEPILYAETATNGDR